jgi:insertion element IS1 protein InsB
MDAQSRHIVGVYVGSRSRNAAKRLWQSLPAVYRQCAVCYTDYWEAYEQVLPSKRHRAVGKETGKTNYIERFNPRGANSVSQHPASACRSIGTQVALVFKMPG